MALHSAQVRQVEQKVTTVRQEVIQAFERMFPESSGPVRVIPFDRAVGRAPRSTIDRALVADVVRARANADLRLLDPSTLRATQRGVTKAGVAWYLTGRYEMTGETYADRDVPLNRFPVIYERSNGERLIRRP